MAKKAKYTKTSVDGLPNDKPVVYRIKTLSGNTNYVGVAKKGRVQERIKEHLGEIPGASVSIEQFGSISDARKNEARIIKSNQPKYNKKGGSKTNTTGPKITTRTVKKVTSKKK